MSQPTKSELLERLEELGLTPPNGRPTWDKLNKAVNRAEAKLREEEPRLTRSSDAPDDAGDVDPNEGTPNGDYLRRYQVRKGTIQGSPASDPQVGSKAERMKNHLLAQGTRSVLTPDQGFEQTVCLNGYRLDFPANTYVDMPVQVADLIQTSHKQKTAALKTKLVDPSNTALN